ncbi:mitochondrial outer membrane protein [Kwoniella heveanensis CBS 569]|nr:mitochondrial outer membrane protein [Kwoniella heveanensis CBS 569]
MAASTPPPPLALPVAPVPTTTSNWTFTQGFILGQASFLVIVLLFVRYVVFSPSEALDGEEWRARRAEKAKASYMVSLYPPPPSKLLGKTNYEMATHAAESTDWVNVLLAQMLQGYRNDLLSANGEEGARQRIEKWLNPVGSKLSWLDPIEVTSLSLGNAFPLLSNARIRPADGQGRIRAEIDVDYLDSISLSLSTAVLVNFPRPRFAVLPVSLGVELVSIGGTLSVQLHEPVDERQHVHASLLPDFHLNLKTTSLLGSRAKLQDIPKLEQLILSRLRSVIQDRFVHPNHISLALPRILSPSVAPTPILNEIGEEAVQAMSEAMSQGLTRMVEDFMGPGMPSDMGTETEEEEYGNDVSEGAELAAQQIDREEMEGGFGHGAVPGGIPHSPTTTRGQKRIPMPANFAAYASSSSNTPLQTPNGLLAARPGAYAQQSQRSRPMASTSSYRATPSVTPSQSQSQTGAATGEEVGNGSQFRFRGQFASNPPTPGLGVSAGGMNASVTGGARRMGAFNSRAGS